MTNYKRKVRLHEFELRNKMIMHNNEVTIHNNKVMMHNS